MKNLADAIYCVDAITTARYRGYSIQLEHYEDRMWVELRGERINEACIDLDHAKRVARAHRAGEPLPVA